MLNYPIEKMSPKIFDKFKFTFSSKKENSPVQKVQSKTKHGNPISMNNSNNNSIQQADTINNHYSNTSNYFHSTREWNYTEFESPKNITGDGTFFSVPFLRDPYITLKLEGTFEIKWKILLKNITSQKIAIVKLITTNKTVSFDYDLLILKDSLTQVQLNDEIEIECDLLDTVKLEISVGSKLDPKSVHLISSPRCYFIGNLSHSIKSKY